jgi:outer membrane protein OmpA-like peptidoglycan-associated protein
VTTAESAYIQKNFAESLAAQPQPPLKFLLYFLPGGVDLDEESKALLPQILAAIRERNSLDIGIHGHSDTVGSTEQNIELSTRRAFAVKEFIVQPGLNIQNLEVTSHGEGNLLVPTPDNVPEPRNRRVEVVVR